MRSSSCRGSRRCRCAWRATSRTRPPSRDISACTACVSKVTYAGLDTSRYRPLVDKYLPRGAGAVFSFDIQGGRAAGQDFIRGVTLWSHLRNVGDSKSLVIHPASTTTGSSTTMSFARPASVPGRSACRSASRTWPIPSGTSSRASPRRRVVQTPRRCRDDASGSIRSATRIRDDSARDPHRPDHRDRRAFENRASRQLLRRLLSPPARYRVIPVNPRETEIFGEKSFKSLADVPVPVDIVNVFRAPDGCPASPGRPSTSAPGASGVSSP